MSDTPATPAAVTYPFTKQNYRDTYASIDPSLPALSAAGKKILITGGATGIGFETSRAFATAGAAKIFIVARSVERLASAKTELSAAFPKTEFVTFSLDITKAEDVKKVFEKLRADGELDIVVLSAAVVQAWTPLLQMDPEVLDNNFDVNVRGNMNVVRSYLSTGAKDKTILNISTGAAHVVFPGVAAYGVTKLAFTQLLDHIYAEHKDEGLRVVQIHPGTHYTPLAQGAGMSSTMFEWDDIKLPAHFSVWLASPEGAFLNGRFVWAAWDVDELKARKEEILANPALLTIGLQVKV